MPSSTSAPTRRPPSWWEGFFDADALRRGSELVPQARSEEAADAIWRTLALEPGARVLDAPCGGGRLGLLLARRGAAVLGVDGSEALVEEALRRAGDLPSARLRYLRHDLREPLDEGDFDAAVNVFSPLGHATEEDDLAVLRTIAAALRPGGLAMVETLHRDAFVASHARGVRYGHRFPDGTLMIEEPRFDPLAGRVDTTWHWWGPQGSGAKSASLRLYTVGELARLLGQAGLELRALLEGCGPGRYDPAGPEVGGRIGLVAARPE